jgi:hypothetical protein
VEQLKSKYFYTPENQEVSHLFFESYTLQNLDPLLLLFQTGYLTLKDRLSNGFFRLDYPNKEVKDSLLQHLMSG